jgi:hypothetical protein
MKKTFALKNIIVSCCIVTQLLFASFLLPQFALAQTAPAGKDLSGLVPCGNTVDAASHKVSKANECGFDDLIVLAQNIINYLIFYIAAPIAALMFAYAGFLMLTNNGNESKVTQAKHIFGYVFAGLVVALAAWLLVNFILDFFGIAGAYRLLP